MERLIYFNCVLCGRPFQRSKALCLEHLQRGCRTYFCDRQCYRRAWRLLSDYQADGRLEVLLRAEFEQIKSEHRAAVEQSQEQYDFTERRISQVNNPRPRRTS
jgi:hypothetical protein